jgi:hypothetical protein
MTEATRADGRPEPRAVALPEHVRVVRLGHGANCSSIGSVVDTLFLTALAGGAIFTAIVAALGQEPVRVVPEPREKEAPEPEERKP